MKFMTATTTFAALTAATLLAGCEVSPEMQQLGQAISPGQLPIPNEYPLLEGDHELWVTLTAEQQARAMLFLQDGSTIQSSLEGDH